MDCEGRLISSTELTVFEFFLHREINIETPKRTLFTDFKALVYGFQTEKRAAGF